MTTAQKEPRIGELFAGYGGLGLGVKAAIGGDVAWFSEFDSAPSKILAHHWPEIPNHGDITQIDWSTVEPVDILTGGFPCQDVSLAGARKGLKDGTRSGLWSHFATAIAELRPSLVVIENVRGLLSAGAGEVVEWTDEEVSDMESATDGVGEPSRNGGSVLNAFGSVLGDLALLGFDAEWVGVRASDAGAPHQRFRVFIVATPQNTDLTASNQWGFAAAGEAEGGRSRADVGRSGGTRTSNPVDRFPTPKASAGEWSTPRTSGRPVEKSTHLQTIVTLLPTTVANDSGNSVEAHLRKKPGRTQVISLQVVAEHMLPTVLFPTPRASRGASSTELIYALGGERDDEGDLQGNVTLAPAFETSSNEEYEVLWDSLEDQSPFWKTDKADYWPAIQRWTAVMGRRAPAPTIPDGKNGRFRLNPKFTEWMMGLPSGWITGCGLTRNEALKACGNGVVWQQAALALKVLLPRLERAA